MAKGSWRSEHEFRVHIQSRGRCCPRTPCYGRRASVDHCARDLRAPRSADPGAAGGGDPLQLEQLAGRITGEQPALVGWADQPALVSSVSALVTVGRRAATRSASTAWVRCSGRITPSTAHSAPAVGQMPQQRLQTELDAGLVDDGHVDRQVAGRSSARAHKAADQPGERRRTGRPRRRGRRTAPARARASRVVCVRRRLGVIRPARGAADRPRRAARRRTGRRRRPGGGAIPPGPAGRCRSPDLAAPASSSARGEATGSGNAVVSVACARSIGSRRFGRAPDPRAGLAAVQCGQRHLTSHRRQAGLGRPEKLSVA